MSTARPFRPESVRKAPPAEFWAVRCPVCGVVLEEETGGRPREYCSDAHRKRAERAEPRIREVARVVVRLRLGLPVWHLPFAGLVCRLLQAEEIAARKEAAAARLPGRRAA